MTLSTERRDETFLTDLDQPDPDLAAIAEEDNPAEPVFRIDPKRDPVGMVFASTKGVDAGGRPHVVTVAHLGGGDTLTCSCAAIRSLGYRPAGCWAMVRAREILGMSAP